MLATLPEGPKSPPLLQFHGEKIKSYGSSLCQIAEKAASQWQVNKPFVIRDAMQDITLEVILQLVFGLSEGKRYQQIKPLLLELVQTIASKTQTSGCYCCS